MKNQLHFVAAFAMLLLLVAGCIKEKKDVIPTPATSNPTLPTYYSIDEVFDELGTMPLKLTVDVTGDASFYGNSGTRYTLFANSLMKANGDPVTGKVDVEVSEYLEKGDMIFSKMLPVSNGEPLLSGGELDIKVSQDGEPVYLKPGMQFQANIPQGGTPEPGMILFRGVPAADPAVNKVNWLPAPKDSNQHKDNNIVIVMGGDTLSIFSDSLKMCNADQFLTSPNYQDFTVTVTVDGAAINASASETKVVAYAVYDNKKGAWPLHTIVNGVINENHVPDIPVHFVVFTIVDGEFYGGVAGATPADGMNYTVDLSAKEPEAFKSMVNGI